MARSRVLCVLPQTQSKRQKGLSPVHWLSLRGSVNLARLSVLRFAFSLCRRCNARTFRSFFVGQFICARVLSDQLCLSRCIVVRFAMVTRGRGVGCALSHQSVFGDGVLVLAQRRAVSVLRFVRLFRDRVSSADDATSRAHTDREFLFQFGCARASSLANSPSCVSRHLVAFFFLLRCTFVCRRATTLPTLLSCAARVPAMVCRGRSTLRMQKSARLIHASLFNSRCAVS